jgi:hypothetical protein
MTFGIVVEGFADEAAYSTLIRRIRSDVGEVVARVCGGKSRLGQKFVGFLEELQSIPIEKALVIRDSDCRDQRQVEDRLEQSLRAASFHPQFRVHFYATSCMLETWLLADEGAVNRVAQQRGKGRSAKPVDDPLEGKRGAKSLFRRMLSQAQLPPDPAVYADVAAVADIERIKQRCPYFRQFIERVNAC